MIDPKDSATVFLDVTAYNSKNYYVQGAVLIPGSFPSPGKRLSWMPSIIPRDWLARPITKVWLFIVKQERASRYRHCVLISTRSSWGTIYRLTTSSYPAIAWLFRTTRITRRPRSIPMLSFGNNPHGSDRLRLRTSTVRPITPRRRRIGPLRGEKFLPSIMLSGIAWNRD